MKRFPLLLVLFLGGFLLMGADGCSSDPNVEGAKLDLRNKDYDRALENVNKALENDPQNAEAYKLKGQVLQEMAFETSDVEEHTQRLQEMIDAYDRAVELDPEEAEDVRNRVNLAYFNEFQRGVQAFNRGQEAEQGTAEFLDAAKLFGNAADLRPDSVDTYVNQAYAYIQAGQTAEAVAPLEEAVDKGDVEGRTFVLLASLYRETDQTEKAIPVLERAREMFPADPDIQSELLNAYVSSGQMDRAMEVYRQAVENEPDNKLYRYNYGSLLLEAERYEEALEHLRKAVELDPQYASAHYNIGAAYINQAVAVNDEISALDDKRMNEKDAMSDQEMEQLEEQMDELAEERTALFQEAIPSLEQARQLADASGEDVTAICQALFQAYAQTGQNDKVKAVTECAGYEDVN